MNVAASSRRIWMILGALAVGVISMNGASRPACAQAAVAEEQAGDAAASELDLTIPEGDAAKIQAFIEKLASTDAQGETQEEQMAYASKVLATIRDAAVKMLAAKPNEEQTLMAERYRLMALQGLSQLGSEDDAKVFAEAIEKAMSDSRPEIASIGWQGYLYGKLATWDTIDEAGKQALLDRVLEKIKAGKPSGFDVSIVGMIAQQLDNTDNEFAAKLLGETLPILQKSDDEEVATMISEANLEGMLRRLSLLGKPMEVTGDLLGGGEIDWKSYRGKVVLVDFSATWCGPCVEEAPNVLKMYEAYKDKGFDVVAVSLDRTEQAAKDYVKANGIKWATIFPKKEEDRYWNNPLARYYGVTGIPTAILVDQKGNAVHMNARGPLLQSELARLLGAPGETKPADSKG